MFIVEGNMEDLDNKWILEGRNDCPEKDTTPATLGLTNMASMWFLSFLLNQL
jgi:hypothetical protein